MRWLAIVIGLCLVLTGCQRQGVLIPAGIDHAPLTTLLQRYVDDQGLVAYDQWRANADDLAALTEYLQAFNRIDGVDALGADRHASLINLYNAATIAEVLRLEPEQSFWDHSPFGERRHQVRGQLVSLDDIEHGALRPEVGYRAHGALVCAAISCPPLARSAFTASDLDTQLDERMAVWLTREDLNRFDHHAGEVHVSKIFSWFGSDFTAAGGLQAVLARHAPEAERAWLAAGPVTIRWLDYDKALNRR